MGINYSIDNFNSMEDVDTLCFNMDVFENNIVEIFYKIIFAIENTFIIKLNGLKKNGLEKNKKLLNNLHVHYKINNTLIEIKLSKKDISYSLGYIKLKLKIFTQTNDKENKDKFNKLCCECLKSFPYYTF